MEVQLHYILTLSIDGGGWQTSQPGPHNPRKEHLFPIEFEAGRDPELVWTSQRKKAFSLLQKSEPRTFQTKAKRVAIYLQFVIHLWIYQYKLIIQSTPYFLYAQFRHNSHQENYIYIYIYIYIQRLTTGQTIRDRIPVRTRFPARPDRPWGPPSLLYNGYRVFPGGKVRMERVAEHSPVLVPRSWKSRAIPLPTLWATPGL